MGDTVELARLEVSSDGFMTIPVVDDETATRQSITTALTFSPFMIEKPTSLRLMADTDEGEIVGPRLLIKVAEIHPATSDVPPVEPVLPKTAKKPRKKAGTVTA